MKKHVSKLLQIAIMLFVLQLMLPQLMAQPIPNSNGPIGSIINVSDSGQVKYWNDTAWIAVAPGLPGQSLQFVNGNPTWIGNPQTTITDYDGNVYDTVKIGTQIWMKQNLNVTHYNNGDAIPNVTDSATWRALTTGAYCNYNNDASNAAIYGRLYNFYTVVDSRNLCPTGWHVPTKSEWWILNNYLDDSYGYIGGKLKEAGTLHWNSPNTGATNQSGFTALPGGSFQERYEFGGATGTMGGWWSTTEYEYGTTVAYWSSLNYDDPYFAPEDVSNKNDGFSVRCLKGQ